MNKNDDMFFEDLERTTDLLKAFKPRISEDITIIENNSFNKSKKEEQVNKQKEYPKTDIGAIIKKLDIKEKKEQQEALKTKEKVEKKQVKKRKNKWTFSQIAFCSFSIIFIIVCIIYII